MTKKLSFMISTFLGFFLVLGSIITIAIIDRPLVNRQPVTFTASTGDSLVGAYYPGTEPVGVMLLEGFGSDQVTMTSLASEFAHSGWHVFIFDYSGHGRSPGVLTFDNAQTDRLAYQAQSALENSRVNPVYLPTRSIWSVTACGRGAARTPWRGEKGSALLITRVSVWQSLCGLE